jgi:hypothetical protein
MNARKVDCFLTIKQNHLKKILEEHPRKISSKFVPSGSWEGVV